MFCKQLMYCVMTKRSHITIQYNMMHYCFLPSYCTVPGHSVTFSSSLFISFTSINKGELLPSLGIGSGNWQTYATYFHVGILSQRDTLTHCSFKPHPCFFPCNYFNDHIMYSRPWIMYFGPEILLRSSTWLSGAISFLCR